MREHGGAAPRNQLPEAGTRTSVRYLRLRRLRVLLLKSGGAERETSFGPLLSGLDVVPTQRAVRIPVV